MPVILGGFVFDFNQCATSCGPFFSGGSRHQRNDWCAETAWLKQLAQTCTLQCSMRRQVLGQWPAVLPTLRLCLCMRTSCMRTSAGPRTKSIMNMVEVMKWMSWNKWWNSCWLNTKASWWGWLPWKDSRGRWCRIKAWIPSRRLSKMCWSSSRLSPHLSQLKLLMMRQWQMMKPWQIHCWTPLFGTPWPLWGFHKLEWWPPPFSPWELSSALWFKGLSFRFSMRVSFHQMPSMMPASWQTGGC